MIETPVLEDSKKITLEDVLPTAEKLSAYDKLVLARILVEQSLNDPLMQLLQPKRVIELYAPIEVSGNLEGLIRMVGQESAKQN